MSISKERNGLLDQNKLIAAFFVILVHSPFPGVLGEVFESLARFAVPFFFMVSGYYAHEKSQKAISKSLIRNLLLLASSVILYFCWDLAWSCYHGTTSDMINARFSAAALVDTFVFNNGVLLGHLWFIIALVYCYLIYLTLGKLGFRAKLIISVSLLTANFLLDIILRGFGVVDAGYFTRNFLFTGLPFFIAGELFAYGRIKLDGKKTWFIGIILVGIVLTLLQRFLIGFRELYFGSVFICVALFALTVSRQRPSSKILAVLGERTTTGIYVLHVIVISCLNMAASLFGFVQTTLFVSARPFLTLFISIAAAYILYVFKLKINSRRVKE